MPESVAPECIECGCMYESTHDEVTRLQEKCDRFQRALEEIAEETGTPYARIAWRALDAR